MGSVRLDAARPGVANLGLPVAIGLQRLIRPTDSGTLYLRINDFPSQMRDNVGEISVVVEEVQPVEKKNSNRPSGRQASAGNSATRTDH